MRKLDVFNHIYPTAYFDRMITVAPRFNNIGKRMRNVPMLIDLDVRFRVMDLIRRPVRSGARADVHPGDDCHHRSAAGLRRGSCTDLLAHTVDLLRLR